MTIGQSVVMLRGWGVKRDGSFHFNGQKGERQVKRCDCSLARATLSALKMSTAPTRSRAVNFSQPKVRKSVAQLCQKTANSWWRICGRNYSNIKESNPTFISGLKLKHCFCFNVIIHNCMKINHIIMTTVTVIITNNKLVKKRFFIFATEET